MDYDSAVAVGLHFYAQFFRFLIDQADSFFALSYFGSHFFEGIVRFTIGVLEQLPGLGHQFFDELDQLSFLLFKLFYSLVQKRIDGSFDNCLHAALTANDRCFDGSGCDDLAAMYRAFLQNNFALSVQVGIDDFAVDFYIAMDPDRDIGKVLG